MQLYETIIRDWMHHFDGLQSVIFDELKDWPDTTKNEMVLRSDMAFELGAEGKFALGGTAITTENDIVKSDEVLLYGKDIHELHSDSNYARLSIVRMKESALGDGNDLYNAIRKVEYVRYHLFPKGCMMRISALTGKEGARISKEAVQDGISFGMLGKMLLKEYHKNPGIEAVKIIFVSLDEFPYEALKKEISRSEGITKAIDHMLKYTNMDCHVCSLQEVCDEVEGLREMHFGTSKQGEKLD